jgi:hypothetical protein
VTRKRSRAKHDPARETPPPAADAQITGDAGEPLTGESSPPIARDADAPITGVAAGSLGTAANLDDTQVMRTADLQATAAWLEDEPQGGPAESSALSSDELALLQGGTIANVESPRSVPPPAVAPAITRPPARATPSLVPARPRRPGPPRTERGDRRLPLIAAGVLAVLLLIAGAGILSQLDLGTAGGTETPQGFVFASAPPATTAEPQQDAAKGHGKCKGNGHGNNCD